MITLTMFIMIAWVVEMPLWLSITLTIGASIKFIIGAIVDFIKIAKEL